MKAKRLIAVVLAFLLIFGNAFSVNAAGIIGEMITDISGLNRLTVSAALNNYFNSRESFLLNQADTINALFADTTDETAHKEKYAFENIVFVDSAISIGDIIASDIYADAVVTETVTYLKDGVTNTATVVHKLLLGLNADDEPTVVYDGYYEAFSGFRSCSYVDEANTVSTNAIGGSGSCIVHVAEGEEGYTEGANEYTKYGEWYTQLEAANGVNFTNSTWCVMFVVWCAAQTNVSNSIIGHYANQIYMQDFFIDQGRYHSRTAAVGDWAPATGDLIFFADDRVNASHIGIVRYVDANYIYVVHGNNSQGKVAFMTLSRTNDWILGYAKPAYVNSGHTYFADVADDYQYDSSNHWLLCNNCDHQNTKHPHSLTYTMTFTAHKASCSTCTYVGNWETHDTGSYESDETHHWKVCSTCNMQVGKEKHLFKEVLYGRVYMCVDCAYESDSIYDVEFGEEIS